MASQSSRAPSPLPSRPCNLNSRNSDNVRRSFSGNPSGKPSVVTNARRFDPITPANSPSDFGRRRSVDGTAFSLKDCEEKENDHKDHSMKASKQQPPAKGSKNFMSPTISAASKFTPSPRKKVLAERNDPVRTSISLSDGKAVFFSALSPNVPEESKSKLEMGHGQNQKTERSLDFNATDSEKKEAAQEGATVSKPLKRVTFTEVPPIPQHASASMSESVITDSDSLKLESSSTNKVSCSSFSPSIAPLDADPSMPPYDPKTNYLSPRPQYLHYRPNPRIEILLNKEKGLDPDEFDRPADAFMAECNFSDSENTEESQSEDLAKEELEVTAPDDMVLGLEEADDDQHVPEPPKTSPVRKTTATATSQENFVKENKNKPRVLTILMCVFMLMMFLIACVSICVTRPPAVNEFALKDLSFTDMSNFYHQSRAADSARANFEWLSKHVNQFTVNSLSLVSKLTYELGQGEKLGPLQYMNLTDLKKSTLNEGNFLNNKVSEEMILEDDEVEEGLNSGFQEEAYAEVGSDVDFENESETLDDVGASSDPIKLDEWKAENLGSTQSEGDAVSSTDAVEDQLSAISQNQSTELEPETQKLLGDIDLGSSIGADITLSDHKSPSDVNSETTQGPRDVVSGIDAEKDQLSAISQNHESELEAETEKLHSDADLGSSTCAVITLPDHESQVAVNPLHEVVGISAPPEPSEGKFIARYVVGGSSLLAAALLAVTTFTYRYKRNPSLANVVIADSSLSKNIASGFNCTADHTYHKRKSSSENWQTESCPSEMSSFQKSVSYSRKEVRETNGEVQSFEKKTRKYNRRESLASSDYSTGSPSYGSFTTYERIPVKHANGEEEIITPVRRSSRIKNHQITSS